MTIAAKFGKPAPVKPGAKSQKKSKWAGLKAQAPRDPFPNVGEYLFEVLLVEEGYNPGKSTESVKITLRVIASEGPDASPEDINVFVTERVSGNGAQQGLSRFKSFIMAAAGFADEDEYDAFDPEGEFIEACLGRDNAFAGSERIVTGRQVACRVTQGRPTADGTDFYRVYAWAPADGGE